MGEFELALMFYHRGKKLRSDLREFQLGINKAQEAIDNSVGGMNFSIEKKLLINSKIQIQIVSNLKLVVIYQFFTKMKR
jgi:hypothetical protein